MADRCVGRSVASVTLCVCLCVRALKGKRLELSTPNLVHVWQWLGMRWPGGQKVKGQGHTDMKTVTVAWLLVAVCCCCRRGLHVVWLLRFLVMFIFCKYFVNIVYHRWPAKRANKFSLSAFVYGLYLFICCSLYGIYFIKHGRSSSNKSLSAFIPQATTYTLATSVLPLMSQLAYTRSIPSALTLWEINATPQGHAAGVVRFRHKVWLQTDKTLR